MTITRDLEYVFPDVSLYQAISSMIANKAHRYAIIWNNFPKIII